MLFLLKYWRYAAAALVVLAVLSAIGYYGHTQRKQGAATVEAKWVKERQNQTAAALQTLQAAIERSEAERKAIEESRLKAADTLLGAINTVRANLGRMNRKLEEDRANDPQCRIWSDSPVNCALPWVPDDAPGADDNSGARPNDIRPSAGVVPVADTTAGNDPADEWRPAPVSGRIARPD